MSDVIAAIATAAVPSAIGIVRLSGDGAAKVAGALFQPFNGKPLEEAVNRKLIGGLLHNASGQVIDSCLAVYTRAPNTYTGEDTVELQCHGAPTVLAAALNALFTCGARQALPGEYTKRAFLNGRMDLTQCEAVVDLIDAQTVEAAVNAAGQLGGTIRRICDTVYDTLRDILAHFHAVLDYPDEDIEAFAMENYLSDLRDGEETLNRLLATFERGQILKSGIRAVILGKPNVGKSSILNYLSGFERVIVTSTPGTTRDTVEQQVRLGGVLVRLLDTAGIRTTEDNIEQLGVLRAEEAAESADLAVFVLDGSQTPDTEDLRALESAKRAKRAVILRNKSDLPAAELGVILSAGPVFPVSARTGAGMDAFCDWIGREFAGPQRTDGSILTNARQADAVRRAAASLRLARQALGEYYTPDAVVVDIEAAMEALGELTGRVVSEDVTNRIFERFCVGK